MMFWVVVAAVKLADDCRKYATESPGVGGALGRASLHFSNAWMQIEKDRDVLHRSLGTQVCTTFHYVTQYDGHRRCMFLGTMFNSEWGYILSSRFATDGVVVLPLLRWRSH